MNIARYPSSLTDAQWSLMEPMLPKPKKRGRPLTDRRKIIEAIFYILKGGIQWRMLPSDYPPWQTVYHVFRKWNKENVWDALNNQLRALAREAHGKRSRPTAAILDSQSVKSDPHGGSVGYDAGKRIKGRKRHILVDTLGLLLGVHITPASTPDRCGAKELLGGVLQWFSWLRKLWVDGGYSGQPLLPRRWVVERTFGWLMQQRRLVRDYEKTEASVQAWVYITMIYLQTRKLA